MFVDVLDYFLLGLSAERSDKIPYRGRLVRAGRGQTVDGCTDVVEAGIVRPVNVCRLVEISHTVLFGLVPRLLPAVLVYYVKTTYPGNEQVWIGVVVCWLNIPCSSQCSPSSYRIFTTCPESSSYYKSKRHLCDVPQPAF